MAGEALATWAASCLLLGLRIAPVFAFAPPFSLTRMPRLFLALFGLGISICLVSANPAAARAIDMSLQGLMLTAFREGALGLMSVLVFQLVFGALYLAGRTLDMQAGFGFATLIDPASQSPLPLVGTLFAYAAAASFFFMNGHLALLRFLAASLDRVPLGSWSLPGSIDQVETFGATVFLVALGITAGPMIALFAVDLVIALLSRTVPQMNVLVLGFQVKTIILFALLPLSFGLAGNIFLRLMTLAIEALPRVV